MTNNNKNLPFVKNSEKLMKLYVEVERRLPLLHCDVIEQYYLLLI